MNREILIDILNEKNKNNSKHVNYKDKKNIICDAIKYYGDGTGDLNLLIVVEELAELQQEIINYINKKEINIGLIEELADVKIGVDFIKTIFKNTEFENEKIEVDIEIDLFSTLNNLAVLQQLIIKYLRTKEMQDNFVEYVTNVDNDIILINKTLIDNDFFEYCIDIKYERQNDRNIEMSKHK
jgi:hypothetical protein